MEAPLPKDRIDEIPIKWPKPERLVSDAMKKPPQPHPEEKDEQ